MSQSYPSTLSQSRVLLRLLRIAWEYRVCCCAVLVLQLGVLFKAVSRYTPTVDLLIQSNLIALLVYGGLLVV